MGRAVLVIQQADVRGAAAAAAARRAADRRLVLDDVPRCN